jgi:hypothetical protein
MKLQFVTGVVMAGVLAMAPVAMQAQAKTSPSVTAANSAAADHVSRELITSTVHEAWVESGRNEDKFFDMVKQLAELSATKRGVTLPDSEAAGRRMGLLIKTNARRDPDQLLYAVVDSAVKQTAKAPVVAAAK